jgi:hypothetical protein
MSLARKKTARKGSDKGVQVIRWTARQSRAAVLVSEGKATEPEICAELRVSRRQLTRWKAHPDFATRVEQLRRQAQARIERYAIAQQERRLARQQDRWDRIHRVIDARAQHFSAALNAQRKAAVEDPAKPITIAPEAITGLVVRRVKPGTKYSPEIEEYEVDTGLLREARELEKQVAQELGQYEADATADSEGGHTIEELLVLYKRAVQRGKR